jgi:glycosyltransferase involved in cell wall biosynthesis
MAFVWNVMCFRHDMVVSLSKDAQQYYKKRWLNKQVEFAYNGIDTIDILCIPSSQEDDTKKIGTIASAGGISYRKGIDQTIKALEKLPKEYRLYIAGKETNESINLKHLIEELNLQDRVVFLGYVSDMDSFINEMDIFVVSPRSEGFSLALQEIASCKKAIVCSDIAIFKELFQSNEVIFFELENIISLQQAILQCFEQKKILSQNAYEKFINNYTSQQMAKKYMQLYNKLLQGTI